MSELFDDDPRAPMAPRPASRRSRTLAITVGGVAVVAMLFMGISAFLTESWWYDSVGYGSVFTTLVWTRVILFAGFGLVMAAAVAANIVIAYRLRPLFVQLGPDMSGLDRYRGAVQPMRTWMLAGISLLMGAFAGTSGSAQWREYLLWRHSVVFGKTDPFFDKDLGFYLFDLPWWHYLVDFVMAVAVVSLLVAGVVHYLFGGIRLQDKHDRISPAAQGQFAVLLGIFVLAKAADYWLDRYDLLTETHSLATGMNYTADHAVLPAKNILTAIAVICAVLFFANVWRRTWLLSSVALGLLALSSMLLGMIWPLVVQKLQVDPSEADKERTYLERSITATRAAYDIADVSETAYVGRVTVDAGQLRRDAISTGIRLVDPALVSETFQQKQQLKGYYTVPPVLDVDRYRIDGFNRDLVVAVRELDQTGIPESGQNWANLHTVYTHGYGLIAAFANQRGVDNEQQTADGDLAWAEENLPPSGQLTDLAAPEGYQGRVYYGEHSPSYSIVGRAPNGSDIELDLPEGVGDDSEGVRNSTYDGKGGVPVDNLFRKAVFATRFGEPNMILSSRVHENSRILYDRDPRQMVEKVAPWLTVDRDPFPTMVDGRVVWVLDGYTTSDAYPNSQLTSFKEMTDDALDDTSQFQTLPTDEINYMRNAVKATVDAYDGTVTLYAWDESDPMLKAWRAAFPGTVKGKDEIPTELQDHMRYPEDLFKVQRYQLASYHVTNATDFYGKNDQWKVPMDPNPSGAAKLQAPYRVSILDPNGGPDAVYSLASVYTPVNRNNLAAFVSVDAEASGEDYGKFRLLALRGGEQVQGPANIANQFESDPKVKDRLFKFTGNGNSQVRYGNLLTLPVGDGLMYVQPIYTIRQGGEGNYPLMRFVVLSFGGDKVGIGTTLDEAINDILGESTTTPPDTGNNDGQGSSPSGSTSPEVQQLLQDAADKFAEADRLQRKGDTEGWARAIEEAQDLVEQALQASEEAPPPKKKDRSAKPES